MYRKAFRKRLRSRVQSFTSATDEDKRSTGSRKSVLAHIEPPRKDIGVSQFGEALLADSKWLKVREYLLILVEGCLSLSVYVVRERNLSIDEVLRLKIPTRKADIHMHYVEGHSAWVSLVFGCLADSYIRYYTMALFSVIFHFVAVCIVFMEDTIKGTQHANPYAEHVRSVINVALVLIRSTDFTRLVYGLEGMTNRRTSTICIFIFFQFWVSGYATYGGVFLNVAFPLFTYYKFKLVLVAFVLSGISLYLFVYFLYPNTYWKVQRGLGRGVIGCLLLATFYKMFGIRKREKTDFFGNTEGTCTKATISRTKELLLLYALLSPTLASALAVMLKANVFFEVIIRAAKTETLTESVGLIQLARTVLSIAMLLLNFAMWPLLTLVGFRNDNTNKFLIGHLLAASAFFYAAILTMVSEPLQYPSQSGFVRVLNTREKPVYFTPKDDFTMHRFEIDPKTAVMGAYHCTRPTLFAMNVRFNGSNVNYTMYLSVVPYQTVGYVVLDPPEVVRIHGPYLPLQEGPPGTNEIGLARMYIYNIEKTMEGAVIRIRYAHAKQTVKGVVIQLGAMKVISLEPATYDFIINRAGIKQTLTVEEGALYGLIIYPTLSTVEMTIDNVLGREKVPIWPLLGLYFLMGLAIGICYPALRAMLFTIAPHGLMAMSFAFLAFLEGMTLWFMYIGFRTWHYYATGNVMIGYAAGVAIFWCVCMYLFLKYKDTYT